ncbi:hypothetical protein WMY93_028345 [Mugilogobius chulae]|uniref:Uncharacterized protein n=1 Tax=Mugilogobius chulae TaxID=88201 RepID=A0AAW0MSK1_9GOBI
MLTVPDVTKLTRVIQRQPATKKFTRVIQEEPTITTVKRVITDTTYTSGSTNIELEGETEQR